jgi:2-polyprenyl-6-methoxyphenol hydroxylase-like FAD-dependent oxidoreductase
MRIGVIGTGVAGSLLTEQLAAAPGIIVEAFDHRDPGAAAGTGLNLGPNAMRALRLHLPARHAAIRVAFVRDFSLSASDTMSPPCDPIAGTRAKAGPDFLAKLRRTYTDIYDRLG